MHKQKESYVTFQVHGINTNMDVVLSMREWAFRCMLDKFICDDDGYAHALVKAMGSPHITLVDVQAEMVNILEFMDDNMLRVCKYFNPDWYSLPVLERTHLIPIDLAAYNPELIPNEHKTGMAMWLKSNPIGYIYLDTLMFVQCKHPIFYGPTPVINGNCSAFLNGLWQGINSMIL